MSIPFAWTIQVPSVERDSIAVELSNREDLMDLGVKESFDKDNGVFTVLLNPMGKARVGKYLLSVRATRNGDNSATLAESTVGIEVVAGRPDHVEMSTQTVQTTAAGAPLHPVQIRVVDVASNSVPNTTVMLQSADGKLQVLSGGVATSDNSGIATFSGLIVRGSKGTPSAQVITIPPLRNEDAKIAFQIEVEPPAAVIFEAGGKSRVHVGAELGWLRARVVDSRGGPVAGQSVELYVDSPDVRIDGSFPLTGTDGYVTFAGLKLYGPPGDYALQARAPGVSVKARHEIALVGGDVVSLAFVKQPWPKLESDSLLRVEPAILATDASGNRMPNVSIGLTIQRTTNEGSPHLYSLQGTTVSETDGNGIATFRELRFFGDGGNYQLRATVIGRNDPFALSDVMTCDPERYYNRSLVVVSAIKSVAGIRPDDEFFDIRFRFRLADWLSSVAGTDISLVGAGSPGGHPNSPTCGHPKIPHPV